MIKNLLVILSFVILGQSYAQENHRTVVARKGDGIYSLLRNNGLEPKQYLTAFIEMNKENLSSENGLFIGKTYLLPDLSEKETTNDEEIIKPDNLDLTTVTATEVLENEEYEIFGKDYANVPIESKKLEGTVFYLISGHGGPDPGAVEHYGNHLISEDEYAYDVTLRLARKLISNSATVYIITRDPDDGIRDERILKLDRDEKVYPDKEIPLNQLERLQQRAEVVNQLYYKNTNGKYQRIIEIHVDSRSKSQNIDVFFYHHERSKSGKKLADNLQETFRLKYSRYQPNRHYNGTVAPRNLYIIRKSIAPTVYVEIGNLKNARDQRRILYWENRDAMAKWISEGIMADVAEED